MKLISGVNLKRKKKFNADDAGSYNSRDFALQHNYENGFDQIKFSVKGPGVT